MSEQTYKLTTIVNSGLWANSYIVFRGQEALVVDPGRDWEQILRFLKANALSSVTVVATHGHFDHVEGRLLWSRRLGPPSGSTVRTRNFTTMGETPWTSPTNG